MFRIIYCVGDFEVFDVGESDDIVGLCFIMFNLF